jgi:SAM-dependent methyltransferase
MPPMNCTACSAPVESPPRETFREPLFGRDFDIHVCGRCGVTFSVIPPDFPLREWYTKAAHLYSEAEWIIHPSPEKDWRFNFFFSKARELDLQGRLLDIGSGDGRFLVRAGEEGWRGALSGLEGNPDMARRRKGNYTVEIGEIQELVERPGLQPYDVVTIFDVLEHLSEPGRSFGHIVRLIRPGGTLVVTVPNNDRIRFLEREAWDFPPNHNTRWTASALADLAKRNGLEVLEVRVSDFTFQSYSDQLFYKLFPIALSGVKRLLYGGKAGAEKTLTDLLAEDAGAEGKSLTGVKSRIADKASRRRIEVMLRDAFKVVMFPFLIPVALAVCLLMPGRKGDCLCLVARKPATRP